MNEKCKYCNKKVSRNSIRCNSCARKGKLSPIFGKKGILAPNYIHGKSKEPYSIEFSNELKEKIRQRDNYTCQLCRCHEVECSQKLDIHHINYNKQNCNENNLISLCRSCNAKANNNRNYWKKYFKNKLKRGK